MGISESFIPVDYYLCRKSAGPHSKERGPFTRAIHNAFPNPFNPSTTIAFVLDPSSAVTCAIASWT